MAGLDDEAGSPRAIHLPLELRPFISGCLILYRSFSLFDLCTTFAHRQGLKGKPPA